VEFDAGCGGEIYRLDEWRKHRSVLAFVSIVTSAPLPFAACGAVIPEARSALRRALSPDEYPGAKPAIGMP